MTSAGNGDRDGTGGGGTGSNGHQPLRRSARPVFSRSPLTPDQGCYGCLIGLAVLLVTVLIWAFIYWYNEPDFHDRGVDQTTPTVQERLHQRIAHPRGTAGAETPGAASPAPGKSF